MTKKGAKKVPNLRPGPSINKTTKQKTTKEALLSRQQSLFDV